MRYTFKCGKLSYSANSISEPSMVKEVSVVIPTYNEERSIEQLVSDLSVHLDGMDYEIIIVDDDSTDKTPAIIDSLASSQRVAALHRNGIRGLFSAIQDGIRASRGRIVIMMDADLSHPPEMVPLLANACKKANLVIASRFTKGSGFRAPFTRKLGPTLLNSACRLMLGVGVSELFTGFHAVKKDKFQDLKFRYPSVWGEFDMELIYRARKSHWRIVEVPFTYRYRKEGTSKSSGFKIVRYAFAYIWRAIQLRVFG